MFQKIKFLLFKIIKFGLISFFLFDCNHFPIKYNFSKGEINSLLGLKLSIYTTPFLSHKPEIVFFMVNGKLFKSSWIKKKNVYLFNPPQGYYQLFAAAYANKSKLTSDSSSYKFVIFPTNNPIFSMEVRRNKYYFMGDIKIKVISKIPQNRESLNKLKIFSPDIEEKARGERKTFFTKNYNSILNVSSKKKFIETSKKYLKGTHWLVLFD